MVGGTYLNTAPTLAAAAGVRVMAVEVVEVATRAKPTSTAKSENGEKRPRVRKEEEKSGLYPYMDFPLVLNHTEIAKSMGVEAVRITDPNEISKEVTNAINSKKPRLIELMIDGNL